MLRSFLLILLLASFAFADVRDAQTKPTFRVGTLSPVIKECSGLIESRKHPGVFWVLSDSGNPATLYAITREGKLIREYPIAAKNKDWEDLAIDDAGHLFIADAGNNKGDRKKVFVMQVDEPDTKAPSAGAPAPLRPVAKWKLSYPKEPFDSEGLFILDGKAYLTTKRLNGSLAEIYRFDLVNKSPSITLEHVVTLPGVRAPVTAADISADGKRLAILTILGPHIFDVKDRDITSVEQSAGRYSMYIDPNLESACFVSDGLLTANEKGEMFLFRDEHFTSAK